MKFCGYDINEQKSSITIKDKNGVTIYQVKDIEVEDLDFAKAEALNFVLELAQ